MSKYTFMSKQIFQMSLMSQGRVKISMFITMILMLISVIVLYMSQMSIVMFTMSVFIIYVQYFKLNVHDVDIKDHGVHDDIHHDQVDVFEGVDHAGNFSGAKP